MTVNSKPIKSGAAPLDRAMLDSAASPTRVLFGLIFLAWSWVSTVLIGGDFLTPLFTSALAPYVAALVFALLVTGIEFVSAGRWPGVYWPVLLLLDAPFTTVQTHGWITALAEPYAKEALSAGADAVVWAAALICGIIAAIFGELLLFGRRRR